MTDFSIPIPELRSTRTLKGTVLSQINVLHALVLHDIKSRFFGNGLGYIVTVLWPGAHIAVVVIAHAVVHHEMPYGDSALVYASTGVLPYISWSYISRFTMSGAAANKPFRQYPVVTALDLMIARQFLEIVTFTIVTIGLISVILLCGDNPMPIHPAQAAFALLSAILLGLGFGIVNGVIVSFFPFWSIGYIVVTLSFYFTSGVIINPETLPTQYGDMLSWNPLLHCVEWMRSAYYDDFPTRLLDKVYVLYVGFSALVFGLFAERIARYFS